MKIPASITRYWLAMNASAFDSAIHACVLFFGAAGLHQATDLMPALDLQQFAELFVISFAWSTLKYLDAHPVLALLEHEDALDRLNADLIRLQVSQTQSIKQTGGGGNATGDIPAEPTAVPAHSSEDLRRIAGAPPMPHETI